VILYPTDTGYAFGCALSSVKGITAIRKLKGLDERSHKPLTMIVTDLAEVGRYGVMSNSQFRLIRRLLPGPYTLILKASSDVPRSMHNRHHEVGIRMPGHPVCDLLLAELGEPLLTGSVTPYDEEVPELEEPEQLRAALRARGRGGRRRRPAVARPVDGAAADRRRGRAAAPGQGGVQRRERGADLETGSRAAV
jgi:tRNA threonylcarbamoyl adenosine modification protein (Sua5/YciO/YrdC/YwlC family)